MKHLSSIAVIICVSKNNRINWLVEAVVSILKQTPKPEEIIIVYDNVCGLKNTLESKLPRSVTIVRNKADKGLSNARNTGIEMATSDIIAFVDDDAIPQPRWAEFIKAAFRRQGIVGVGGRVIPVWLDSGKRPVWFPEELDWIIGCTPVGFAEDKSIIRNAYGCNMAFKREELLRIGGFEQSLGGPVSGDDTDICLRIASGNNSNSIIYEPQAVVKHFVPRERQSLKYIASSAWRQGIGKAITHRLHRNDTRTLSSEIKYLSQLIFLFIPHRLSHMFRHPSRSLGGIISITIMLISIGSGFVFKKIGLVKGEPFSAR
ncbi:glycosyltransferase family 2 protein [Chloroflexota bacterium]